MFTTLGETVLSVSCTQMVPIANKHCFISFSKCKAGGALDCLKQLGYHPKPGSLPLPLRASYYFSPFRWQPQPKLEFATEHRALIPGQVFIPLSYFPCPECHTRHHLTNTFCGVDFLHFSPRGCIGWSASSPHQWLICPPMCHTCYM